MISTEGMSPFVGITLVRENRETFKEGVRNDPTSEREIEAFKERIGGMTTVKDLTEDYEVFSFVMKSFGLEDEIYAKAMMEKILSSDPEDSSSLANRLTDNDYTVINEVMGFDTEGLAGENFTDPAWIDEMVDRYVDQRLIDTQKEVNEDVGLALTFEQKVADISNWYDVLADEDLTDFFMTAFGLPDDFDSASVDGKARMFADRMDIEDLQDPETQEKMIRQFAAFSDAEANSETSSAALTILSSGSGFAQATIDVEMVQGFSASAYR